MSRQIQIGDLVQIKLANQKTQFPITRINGLYIYIMDPIRGGESLVYPSDDGWKVYGAEDKPYEISFMASPEEEEEYSTFLTGDPFIDQNILEGMNKEDLIATCSSSKSARIICQPLFMNKIVEKYGKEIANSIPDEEDKITAFYELNHATDELDDRKLDPRVKNWSGYMNAVNEAISNLSQGQKFEERKHQVEMEIMRRFSANLFADNYVRLIREGKLYVLKYLYEIHDIYPKQEHLYMAIGYGLVPIIDWMIESEPKIERGEYRLYEGLKLPDPIDENDRYSFSMLKFPIDDGHLDLIQYLLDHNKEYLKEIECNAAALGKFEVMTWLVENNYPILNVIDCAVDSSRNIRSSTYVDVLHVSHLEYQNYYKSISESPEIRERANQMAQWLHKTYGQLPKLQSVKNTLKDGNVDLAMYFEPYGLVIKDQTTGRTAASRALTRYIDAEKYVEKHAGQTVEEVREHNLKILRWLKNKGFTPTQKGRLLQIYNQIV